MNTKCFPIFTRENFAGKVWAVRIFLSLFLPHLSVTVITAITVKTVIAGLAAMATFTGEEIEDERGKKKVHNEEKAAAIKSWASNGAMRLDLVMTPWP